MKNLKKDQILYYTVFLKDDTSGDVLPQTRSKKVPSNFIKRYRSALCFLVGVDGCPRNLIDYYCDTMDKNNTIGTAYIDRLRFIDYIHDVSKGKVNYTDSTVKTAIAALKERKLLIHKSRGCSLVNPVYFSNSDEPTRYELIRLMLEIKYDTNNIPITIEKL